MKMKRFLLILACGSLLLACGKEFLDERPNRALMVPSTAEDFQALLDNYVDVMNWVTTGSQSCTDEVSIANGGLAPHSVVEINFYTWQERLYLPHQMPSEWQAAYQQIYYANVVLEGLEKIKEHQSYASLRGSALFFRAWAHFNLLQLFAPPYEPDRADDLLGIPIRLSADINEKASRPPLSQCYAQILKDITEATELLPEKTNLINRPSKAAAWAFLARVHLVRQDYLAALEATDRALSLQSGLVDYATINASGSQAFADPIVTPNPEIIFYGLATISGVSSNALVRVDSFLYDAYQVGDLRKTVLFNANRNFKASYLGRASRLFAGLATDELYLIRAESATRLKQDSKARKDLLTLLEKRYQPGKLPNLDGLSGAALLDYILLERRKELYLRGLRWPDLRRLNQDPQRAVTLRRQFNGKSYELPPRDLRYTMLLPESEIEAYGLEQNPR